jgi:rubrerythrin
MTANPKIAKCKCGNIFWDWKKTGVCPFCDPNDKHHERWETDKNDDR